MARRSSRKSSRISRAVRRYNPIFTVGRDLKMIASPRLPRLSSIVDNRLFHPLPRILRRSRILSGAYAPIKVSVGRRNLNAVYSFKVPSQTVTCVRRHRRREVLFAQRRAGKGRRNFNRTVHRNAESSIRC